MECSISDVSLMMRQAQEIISRIKLLSVNPDLTMDDAEWFLQSKRDLSSVLSNLKSLPSSLVEKNRKRQNKRRREKLRRERRDKERKNGVEREKKMDEWMRKVREREQIEQQKLKNSRALSLKLAELDKHMSLLSHLEKLDRARGGDKVEPATLQLSAELSRLRDSMQTRAADEKEDGGESRQWLFNTESSPERNSPDTLLKIRSDWDQFISSEATASSIPIGWVTPSSECIHCEEACRRQIDH